MPHGTEDRQGHLYPGLSDAVAPDADRRPLDRLDGLNGVPSELGVVGHFPEHLDRRGVPYLAETRDEKPNHIAICAASILKHGGKGAAMCHTQFEDWPELFGKGRSQIERWAVALGRPPL